MKVLALSHDFPSPSFSDTLPMFYLIKHLSSLYDYEITLITFLSEKVESRYIGELGHYCSIETPIRTCRNKPIYRQIFRTIKNAFDIRNLSKKATIGIYPNLLDCYYSYEMHKKIENTLKKEKYDIIYSSRPMANYILDAGIPKVIQPFDAVHEWHRQVCLATRGAKKLVYRMTYILTKVYERQLYTKFDACLVVTQNDKKLLNLLCPEINCIVLPNGVDTEYFRPMNLQEEYPSLVFVSNMSGHPTIDNVLYFYNNIYPTIRKEIPEIKVYLVGRDPAKEIVALKSDQIIVTGYVDDVRPYLAKSSIFIAPMILGTGIKNKVLEAMAMGKPVVTTSVAIQGIDAVQGRDVFTTDNPHEFAEYVVELLNNKRLREKLGRNARRFIENKYSWKKMAEKLDQIFKDIVGIKK